MELHAVGGYSEVGKNMTGLSFNNESVIFDMGFFLPEIINFEEEVMEKGLMSRDAMIKKGAIPNDNILDPKTVKALFTSHCHLDHIGAIPFLAPRYDAPIISSPYTIDVIKRMMIEDGYHLKNHLKPVNLNSSFQINKDIKVELVGVTHSTPQTAILALHTPEGVVVYANDFKFDNHPVVGKTTNTKRLKELGKKGVKALIVESLYSDLDQKTPSEKVAREMLKEVLHGTENSDKAIFATTFASHIARLQSILDFGHDLRRKVVFVGRSFDKYIVSAEKQKLVNFTKHAIVLKYRNEIDTFFRKLNRLRDKYLVVCTGGQGEPNSVLSRVANGQFNFDFKPMDQVIFSNRIIPAELNIENRRRIEEKLKERRVRIFSNIHVSGHSSREDLRDLITILKPLNLIPTHAGFEKQKAFGELAEEEGYKVGENVHLLENGKSVKI